MRDRQYEYLIGVLNINRCHEYINRCREYIICIQILTYLIDAIEPFAIFLYFVFILFYIFICIQTIRTH